MLGDFINRILILMLGYAYPGFECYKTVEKNRVDIEELRFWCKYWIIVALFTTLEKFVDIFIWWLPFYGESKVVLFIYLWYPKTKGTSYIYETVMKPLLSRHENDIDRSIMEWKARAWDYVMFYWQYLAQYGSGAFVQAIQYMASQSMKFSSNVTSQKKEEKKKEEKKKEEKGEEPEPEAAPAPAPSSTINKMKQSPSLSRSKKWPPSPPSSPSTATFHRNVAGAHRSRTTLDKTHTEQYVEEEEDNKSYEPETTMITEDESVRDRINKARARLRKLDSSSSLPRSPRTPTAS